MAIKRYAGALFDPLVVVTMMTTVGLIVGILALAIAQSGPSQISRKIIALCFVVGFIGLITIVLQIRTITKQKRLRSDLTVLYLQGREVSNRLAAHYSPDRNAEVEEWKTRVTTFLTEEMESSHVARFQTSDFRVLLEFIKELGG